MPSYDYTVDKDGWFPAAAKFARVMAPLSNYPMAYVYATFLTLSGHVMGRQSSLWYFGDLYPNHYTCLVGPSAIAHKSTAMNMGLKALGDYGEGLRIIKSLTTSAGLLKALKSGDGMCLIHLDELNTMLAKKEQSFATDLLTRVTELYGCPDVAGNWIVTEATEVQNTFTSILSGSTEAWLQTALTANDLMGGFGNRMTFVLGRPRKVKPWSVRPDFSLTPDWQRLFEFEGEVKLDESAQDVWGAYHSEFMRGQEKASPFLQTLAERMPEKVLKAAMVIAAWENTHYIDDEMLAQAIHWGKYIHRCLEDLAPAFEDTEKQVLQAIKSGYNTRPKLFGALSHVFSVRRLREAVGNLKWLGLVEDDDTHLTPT